LAPERISAEEKAMKNSLELKEQACRYRREIIRCICRTPGGHFGSALSVIELLTVLYHRVLRIDPAAPDDPGRDRFILSKGHAAIALYCVLAEMGFFPRECLDTFGLRGTILGGHPDMIKVPGVEASTGALGHGLSFAVGAALAGKMSGRDYRVFALLGDGECQEGSVWEAALFAPCHRLDNLTVIIDYNKMQAMDRLDKIVSLEPLARKWDAFGWKVSEVDGHDLGALTDIFSRLPREPDRPGLIIAHTVKGKGVSFMEGEPIWHYRLPDDEERKVICRELGLDEL
jgi:transketolase